MDFTNSKKNLVNTFATQNRDVSSFSVNPLDPVGQSVVETDGQSAAIRQGESRAMSLAPATFDPSMNVVLSDEVKKGIADTRAAAKAARDLKRQNNSDMLRTMADANSSIGAAQDNLETINSVPFAYLLGAFNDDYSPVAQQRIINDAQQSVVQRGKVNNLKLQNSLLNLEDAQAPLKQFESLQKARKGLLDNTSAQMNAITQSNTALKAYRDFAFDVAGADDIASIEKSGNYDQVFSKGAIKAYKDKQRKFDLNMKSLELANAQNNLELRQGLEDELLSQVSQNTLESLVLDANTEKTNNITLKNGQKISLQKANAAIAAKSTVNQNRIKEINAFSDMNVENVAGYSVALRDVAAVSNVNNTSGVEVETAGFDLMNTTVETLQTFDFDSIHPFIRQETTDVMLYAAQLNAQESVSREDVQRQQTKQAALDSKIAELKTTMVENAPDKQTERATKEMLANGKMANGKNASAMTMSMLGGTPSFAGDAALQASFKSLADNVLSSAGGGTKSFLNADGELDLNAMLNASIKTGSMSKTAIIQNALLKKNEDGKVPVQIYGETKAATLMWTALEELGQKYPEIQDAFFQQGQATPMWVNSQGGQDHGAVALKLAEMAVNLDPTKGPVANLYNIELGGIINKLIGQNAQKWNSQVNMQRGSFMVNMFTNGQPSEVVDNSIQYSYFNSMNEAWAVQSAEAEQNAAEYNRGEKIRRFLLPTPR